jgi:hypothetical protein
MMRGGDSRGLGGGGLRGGVVADPGGRLAVTAAMRPVLAAERVGDDHRREITGTARARQRRVGSGEPAEAVGLLAGFAGHGVLAAVQKENGTGIGVEDVHLPAVGANDEPLAGDDGGVMLGTRAALVTIRLALAVALESPAIDDDATAEPVERLP